MSNSEYFLNKTLGGDFLESLAKSEIYKPGSKTVVDTSDMHLGLKLVPRVIMALLIKELAPMKIGENKELIIPVEKATVLRCTKHERDSLSGELFQENVKIAEFLHRSIPGIGLVLLSALELYSLDDLDQPVQHDDQSSKLQRMIDDRLALHELIGLVIDKKLMQREAIHQLVLSKLTEAIQSTNERVGKVENEVGKINPLSARAEILDSQVKDLQAKKVRPLQSFLEKRKAKKEFSIVIAKSEQVDCPDCGANIFDGKSVSACICYGDSGKVFLKKTESGVKISFGKNWEMDDIEMLLETLRKSNKGDV